MPERTPRLGSWREWTKATRSVRAAARRARWARTLGLLALLAAGLACLRVALWRPPALVGEPPGDGFTRAAGVVHVHTTLSDGGGTPAEVIAAAQAAGLDFLGITDHNNVDAAAHAGRDGGVLVLAGSELSTTAGHLVGLGLARPVFRFSGDALDGLDDVRHLGGVPFAAHPLSPRQDLRWTGWDLPGPWGVELVNGDTEWRRAGPRLLLTAALYRLNRPYALLSSLGSARPMLERWDALLARRDVTGIFGADAHSRIPLTRRLGLRFPPYEALFGLARNHLLLDTAWGEDAAADTRAVLEAFRRGRLYLGLDALAPADGFSFVVEGQGSRATMGDTLAPAPGLRARAGGRVPRGVRLVLLRDGRPLQEARERLEAPIPGPGVYRVEAYAPGWVAPWVLTNPIYVFDPAAAAERAARAVWPEARPAPPTRAWLDRFEDETTFAPAADARSTVAEPILDAHGGLQRSGSARLRFELGTPTPEHAHVHCALVSRQSRDLSGHEGLVVSLRADGEYRIWVQVRDENPRSKDDGTEWWFTSVRTSTEWRRVALPFSRLRSIDPDSDGRLDLDRVRALVFVLDRGSIEPGTRGVIWIDDLGLY